MAEENPNSRLEAFCDGVFAIALTLLIIDVKIPSTASITTTGDFWLALRHITPSIFAFLLSFAIILITWVNHHNGMKLVNGSTTSFMYANGVLLLGVVVIPFPTSLLGEYLFTDHSAPAVILYESVMALLAVGWILITTVAMRNRLAKNVTSALTIRQNNRYGYFALTLYSLCAILAAWFPLAIAIITTFIWMFWLIAGINIKHDKVNRETREKPSPGSKQ
jgi:uncharacterized membrane protein